MIEDGAQLRWLKAHVEWHHDGADQRRAIVAFEELMIVKTEKRHAVAALDAFRQKAGRQTLASFPVLRVGKPARAGHNSYLVTIEIHSAVEAADWFQRQPHGILLRRCSVRFARSVV